MCKLLKNPLESRQLCCFISHSKAGEFNENWKLSVLMKLGAIFLQSTG